jgi:energy-coupling factor transporter ATP-binding protein EcfA2
MEDTLDHLTVAETNALLKEATSPRDVAILTLFISTGLFLNELCELNANAIDWKTKTVTVTGPRLRTIPLNDQAYTALVAWSKERPETPCLFFFITTKGKVKGLSTRSINHLIHETASRAGFKDTVNVHTLRNTFAVSLFQHGATTETASTLLGITDYKSLHRYAQAADPDKAQPLNPSQLEALDTRSKPKRLLAKVFVGQPKPAKPKVAVEGSILPDPETVIFGRDGLIQDIRSLLIKGQSILITGNLGLGKSHVLKHIASTLAPNTIYLSAPTPMKSVLNELCEKLFPGETPGTRSSAKAMLDTIEKNKTANPPILIIDNMNKLKASDIESFLFLLENFTILGATSDTSPKLKAIWWKFKTMELKPLDDDAVKSLIRYQTQNLSISDTELMETKILSVASGSPLAVSEMIHQLRAFPVVTRKAVQSIYHEAGVRYRDWTPIIIILWGVMILFRFISLGTHSFEGYILAGIGMSVIMVSKFFLFKMR